MRSEETKQGASCAGFTLIEVMLVVIIIGILAAVVVTNFSGQGDKARRNATRMSIKNVCTAVEAYEMEVGRYPSSLSELTQATEDRGALLNAVPTDSWGTELQYKVEGSHSYEIRSAGPDEQFGSGDDLTSK